MFDLFPGSQLLFRSVPKIRSRSLSSSASESASKRSPRNLSSSSGERNFSCSPVSTSSTQPSNRPSDGFVFGPKRTTKAHLITSPEYDKVENKSVTYPSGFGLVSVARLLGRADRCDWGAEREGLGGRRHSALPGKERSFVRDVTFGTERGPRITAKRLCPAALSPV